MEKQLESAFVEGYVGGLSSGDMRWTRRSVCRERLVRAGGKRRAQAMVRWGWTAMAAGQGKSGRDIMIEVNGNRLCVDYYPGSAPTVVFLPGFFYARYQYAKSNALQMFCKRKGQGFMVHDYYGIGRSEGDFRDGNLSRWVDGTVEIMDKVLGPDSRCVLVGSGIGGWIMLHVALRRKQNVVGLVGLSADPDFTDDLLLPNLSEEQKATLESEGIIEMRWGMRTYPISKNLIEDARNLFALRGGPGSIDITCPVRLIQGLADEEIPPQRSLKLLECLKSEDATITFVKHGDHVLENDDDFKRMWEAWLGLVRSNGEGICSSPVKDP
mmetsp:Transcript_8982/g.18107  ORF Transcript_8982/g.18107 Transcript_8982/m.18107 type:complete len:326 (-) Transcript_8982:292-1269(-)